MAPKGDRNMVTSGGASWVSTGASKNLYWTRGCIGSLAARPVLDLISYLKAKARIWAVVVTDRMDRIAANADEVGGGDMDGKGVNGSKGRLGGWGY